MVDPDPFSYRSKVSKPVSGSIERQIGEIVATLRAQHEDIGELKVSIAAMTKDQRESVHDRRNQQQIMTSKLEALERTTTSQNEILRQATSAQHQANNERLESLTREIASLKDPVGQFVSIRKRAGTIAMVFVGICSVVWTLAQPIYSFFVTKFFSH